MAHRYRLPLSAAILALLTGCAQDPARCPPIPGGPVYCLQASTAVPSFHTLQDLRVRRGELDERLIAGLEVDATGMRLVGFTPLGQRLLSAEYDNRAARAESLAGDRVDARALLSLAQLAAWPADSVRAGLGAGWELEDTPAGRRVSQDTEVALDIIREGEAPAYRRLVITMPRAGMTVEVRVVEEEENFGR